MQEPFKASFVKNLALARISQKSQNTVQKSPKSNVLMCLVEIWHQTIMEISKVNNFQIYFNPDC